MSAADLDLHLATGATSTCLCWAVTRRDGLVLGFTDHDRALAFDDIDFRPETGLSASAVMSSTGLAVDNAEALGALSSDAISETDIEAGLFDGAEVRLWQVNWAAPSARALRFAGMIGDIRRGGGAFHAELRGLSEALNQPMGRAYLRTCAASLGDAACRADLDGGGLVAEVAVEAVTGSQVFSLTTLGDFPARWFERGRIRVLGGAAAGLIGAIKIDRQTGESRVLTLWEPLARQPQAGDAIRIEAGCDQSAAMCRTKFNNLLNFRGFPDLPGDEWITAVPRAGAINDGGSCR